MPRSAPNRPASVIALLSVTGAAIPATAIAATPSDLSDLVGSRAAGGETQLEARGYTLHHASAGDDKSYAYWWNGSAKKCVRVTTEQGRYSNIKSESSAECGQKSNDAGAAAVIGAAAILGVAALASKSHHREDRYPDANSTAEFERGYRDGLYNQSYHNYSRSNGYTDGYEQGVRQRGYETSYRSGYHYGGGYSAYINVTDLVGKRSADARSELGARGFVERNEIAPGGGGHIRTFWRAASEQCIVLHTRDSYVYSIDTARKRNCR